MARSGKAVDDLHRIAERSQGYVMLRYRDAKDAHKDVGRGITEQPEKVREGLRALKSDDIKDRGFMPAVAPPKRRRGPVRLGK